MRFFLMSQGSLNPKIRFLGKKKNVLGSSLTDKQTHRQTDTHEREYRGGHPFGGLGFFPSKSVQNISYLRISVSGNSSHSYPLIGRK